MSPDPQQAVLDTRRIGIDAIEDKPHNESFDETSVLALCYSLSRTIQSMARYGRSISALLQEVTCATRGPHGIARRERLR